MNPTPWLDAVGTTSQYFPIFIGSSPKDLVLTGSLNTAPELPASLKGLAERQAAKIMQTLEVTKAHFQIWPTEDWGGQPAWVFARWRPDASQPWRWLSKAANWSNGLNDATTWAPELPDLRDPGTAIDKHLIFDDFLEMGLYDQPLFGNCVFVVRATGAIAVKWPDLSERVARAAELSTPGKYSAHCVNQPARFNHDPVAFELLAAGSKSTWSANVRWTPAPAANPPAMDEALRVTNWPADFERRYRDDLAILAGEADAHYPASGATRRFIKKGAFQPDHDLEHMATYLEERYAALGVATRRQRFTWRGIAQSNVIAILPGTTQGAPVVLGDHYDTAVEEDTFQKTGERVTTHGCNDNVTATALLLRAAEVLETAPHKREIWLVHFTGEEFPADGLGAWHFLGEMMREKQDIYAALITDFIGWTKPGLPPAYQVNPAATPGSEHIASLVLDASAKLAPTLTAHYRPRNHPRNSVFQTDVQEFEYYGFPALLVNENIDYTTEEPRDDDIHHHRSTDVCGNVMVPFATSLSKVAIETVARLADE